MLLKLMNMVIVHQHELQALAEQLQQELEASLPRYSPFTVQSIFRKGNLLVWVRHQSDPIPNLQQITVPLVRLIRQQQSDSARPLLEETRSLPIQLNLQIAGQESPYSSHSFVLELPPPLDLDNNSIASQPVSPQDFGNSAQADVISGLEMINQHLSETLSTESSLTKRSGRLLIPPRHSLPAFALGIAVGLFTLASGVFALSRPCVIGDCAPLQKARQLSQVSLQVVQTTASTAAVLQSYDQLVEANYLLGTIPPWSRQRQAAQALLKSLEAETEILEQVVEALYKGNEAAHKSQNPPHPLPHWRAVQDLWQQAIALLEQIPQDSYIHPLAQQKLQQYNANLGMINQRLLIEQQAQVKVDAARKAAQLAETRQGIANSFQDWQLAYATWDTAVTLLRQVPQSTMPHAEAQQLLEIYQPKLAAVRDRRTQEEISANTYNQAIRLAEQAYNSERSTQWSVAVAQWKDALTNVQQVPNNTSYYSQAQPLISSYQSALSRAREHLRVAVAVQNAQIDLNRICVGMTQVCTYRQVGNAIQVHIIPDYDQAVEQTMTYTPTATDYANHSETISRAGVLLQAVAAVSEKVQVPIELYSAGGSRFGTYDPELSGYVRR